MKNLSILLSSIIVASMWFPFMAPTDTTTVGYQKTGGTKPASKPSKMTNWLNIPNKSHLSSAHTLPPALGVTATKTVAITNDTGPTGATSGDELEYTILISSSGSNASGVIFTDAIDPNTTLVANSLKVSPIAVEDSYNSIGNVGIDVPQASGLLNNDISPNGATLSIVSPTPTTTTGGGTLNINPTTGAFTYLPAAGYEGSDTFTYTLQNGSGLTSTATVTITVSEVVWFIDNNASNGDGRLGTPFSSIANFNMSAADEAGDIIFLYRNTATDYTDPLTLLNDQKLIGAGASASIATIAGIVVPTHSNSLPNTGGTNPNLTSGATTLTLGQNNLLRGFSMGNSTLDISGTSFGTLIASEVALNGTGAALSLSTGAVRGPNSASDPATFTAISSTDASSSAIILNTVTGNLTSSGGTTVTNPTGSGISLTDCTSGTFNFGNTTLNQSSNTALNISGGNNNVTFGSLDIAPDANAKGIVSSGYTTGTLTTTNGTITAVNNSAIDINGAKLAMVLTSITATNSAATGIILNAVTGNLTSSGGTTVTNPTGSGISLTNCTSGTFNFGNTTLNQSSGTALNISGGSNNVTFGSLDIAPDAGAKGIVSSGYTTGTLTTTNGTITAVNNSAIDINGAKLAMVLTKVSSSNTTKGLILTNLNNSSTFTINGSGTTNGSGGVISTISQRGIEITGSPNITLKNMELTSANTSDGSGTPTDYTNYYGALYLNNVSTITLDNIDISGTTTQRGISGKDVSNFTLTNSTISNCGDETDEGCVFIQNLSGTCSITNSSLTFASSNILRVLNTSKTLNLTVNNSTLNNTQANANGSVGIHLESRGTSNTTGIIKNNTLNNIKSYGIFCLTAGTSTSNIDITNNTIDATAGGSNDVGVGVSVVSEENSITKFNVIGNPLIKGKGTSLINIRAQGNASMEGRVNSNTVQHTGPFGGGGANGSSGNGLSAYIEGNSALSQFAANMKIEIDGNTISGVPEEYGIDALSRNGTGRLDAIINNNTVTLNQVFGTTGSGSNIAVTAGVNNTSTNTTCAKITNNKTSTAMPATIAGAGANGNLLIYAFYTNNQMLLQGSTAGGLTTHENLWNNNTNTPTAPTAQFAVAGTFGSATCNVPTNPLPAARIAAIPLEQTESPSASDIAKNTSSEAVVPPLNENPTVLVQNEDKAIVGGEESDEKQVVAKDITSTTNEKPYNQSDEAARIANTQAGETVRVDGTVGATAGSGFTIPSGKSTTIKFRVTINNNLPNNTCTISNQGTVSSSTNSFPNVLTDDPGVGGSTDPTVIQLTKFNVGNLVFNDVNRNGIFDAGDAPLSGVSLNLYADADGNNGLTGADGAALATTTTNGSGIYNFNVCPGVYIVAIAPSNFQVGGALYNSGSPYVSSPVGGAGDPDTDTDDNDDNGDPVSSFGIATSAFTVNNDNATIDFGLKVPTTVTINDLTLNEGTSGSTTSFSFTVTRSNTSEAFNLAVNTTNGSAASSSDYTAISGGTVSFTAGGSLTQTVTVLVNHDNIVENNETFNVVLSGAPAEVVITDATGEGTIDNDDTATLTFSGGNAESESQTSRTFTATLSAPVQGGFKANYYIANGSATSTDDYTGSNGALTFVGTANEPQSLTVTITNDNKVELNEDFSVSLAPVSADITMTSPEQQSSISVSNASQTETIINDDAAVVNIIPVSQAENLTPQVFSVTLCNPVDVPVNITANTTDGTATTTDNDYNAVSNGSVAFPINSTTAQTVNVTINNDNKVEANEVFNLVLSALSATGRNVTFSGGNPTLSTTGTITNDDAAIVTLSATASPLQLPEGNTSTTNFGFTATLNNPVQGGFTVAYTTSDGLALTPEDYQDNDGSLTFAGTTGETKNITVLVNGDLKVEANESFFVNLGAISGAPAGVTTAGSPQQGLIVNDELDWGDAPDTYNTLSASNGARHNTSLAFHLGATVDGNLDGQPTGTANGDDTDAEGDDDDGITLPAAFITGTTANVTVNASGAGRLNAWVDFNNDGDWGDMGEQIFDNVPVMTGNNALSFAVPAGATPSTTFARFRYTTASVMTPAFTGLQTTGEVEDYQVTIINNQYNISSPTVAEGNAGPTNLTFAVSRTNGTGTGSVDYSVPTGTATSGTDYNALAAGTVNFANGETSKNVTVTVNGDLVVEDNETVILTLSNPVNGAIATGTGTGIITNDDNATLTLSGGSSQNEGNAGSTVYTFTATLSAPVQGGFQINYTTGEGTATAGTDYTDNDGTLTFAGTMGETQSWTVNGSGDNTVELNETFEGTLGSITMTSAVQALAISKSGLPQTSTIANDDQCVISFLAPFSTSEGNSGTKSYALTINMSNKIDVPIVVAFAHSNGTATFEDNDYVLTVGSTSIGLLQPLTVTIGNPPIILGDLKVEGDEFFYVTLSENDFQGRNIVFAGGGTTLANTVTLTNDDNATVTFTGGSSANEGNSGTNNRTFTATLDNPVQGGFTVAYTTNNGTATTADNDYVDNDGTLTFTGTANEPQTITVQVKGDLNIEADETFTVQLGAITAATPIQTNAISIGGTNPQTAILLNDELDWGDAPDSYLTLLSSNGPRHATVPNGLRLGATIDADLDGQPNANATGDGADEDGVTLPPVLVLNTTANLTVNASATGKLDAWVDFNNNGSFADAGEKVFNNVALVAGDNALNFAVPNGATPSNSFARFRLSTAGGLSPTGLAADGEVEDYAIQIVNTQFSINDVSITEGNAGTTNLTFTISRTVNANACSVNYAITGGTATSGADYQPFTNGTVNFTAGGALSQTVTVVINGDNTVELNETVLMTLSMPVNGAILDGAGTGTITNDDAAVISISNPSVSEGTSGTANLTFDITMTNPADANVVVNYTTVDGTATTADNDYQVNSASLTFTPGQTTKQVTVTVNGDCKIEANETLLLRLSGLNNNGRNVSLSGGGATLDGTGTIINTPLPTATILGTTAVCQNAPSPNITFTGSSGTAPYTFTYKINGGPDLTVSTSSMSNTVTVPHNTNMAGGFSYTLVSVSDSYCSQNQSGSATITVNPLPTASISGTTQVCQNAPFPTITFTGSNGMAPYTFTYKINGGADLTITTTSGNSVSLNQTTAAAGTFVYSLVSVKDASSTQCSQSQSGSATITVNPLPLLSFTGPNPVCQGLNSALSANLPGAWTANDPSKATIAPDGTITTLTAGTATFTFTVAGTGCQATTSPLTIKPTPTSALTASKYDVCPNTPVTLNPNCSIPTATVNWNPGGPTVTPDAATVPYIYKARCVADGCVGNETSVEVRTHRILVDMKDLDVGALPLPIVRSVIDNMAPTNQVNAPVFPRRWTFIANGCEASESAVFKLLGPVNFNAIDNAGVYAMFANDSPGGNLFYSIDHPNYGNGGSFPNGTYTLTIDLRSQDGVGGPFPKNRVAVGSLLATRTLQFTVGSPAARQAVGSELWAVGSGQFAEVAPNPVSNIMRLKVTDAKGQKVNVSLLDASGRTMLKRDFVPETHQHQEEFNVGDITNGMYFLRVNTADKNATLKVVKVE